MIVHEIGMCVRTALRAVAAVYALRIICDAPGAVNLVKAVFHTISAFLTWPMLALFGAIAVARRGKWTELCDAFIDMIRNYGSTKTVTVKGNVFILMPPSFDWNDAEKDFSKVEAKTRQIDGHKFEDYCLTKMQRKLGLPIVRNHRLPWGRCVFDGVIDNGRNMMIIETKYASSNHQIEEAVKELENYYYECPEKIRRRLSFVLCVGTSKELRLKNLNNVVEKSVVHPDLYLFSSGMEDYMEVFAK